MKKYKVTYYSAYHVAAENKDEAIKKADKLRWEDPEELYARNKFSFGVKAEEIIGNEIIKS